MNNLNLLPYQEKLLTAIQHGGFKPGEMMIMSSGRQIGKSMLNAAYGRLMADLNKLPVTDLVLSEGKVYGARYYCVEPVGGSWIEMEQWCMDTFGGPGDRMWGEKTAPEPAQRWYMNNRKFWFRNEKDRNWFILRWRA